MRSAVLASVAALALCGAAGTASASTYEFTISDENVFTGGPVTPDVFFTVPAGDIFISSASGTINGSAVTGLDPTNINVDFRGFLDATFITASGVTYGFNAVEYSSTAGDSGNGTFNLTAVSAVPLPAGLPMFGAALLGLGAVGFSLTRNRKAGLPA